MPGPVSVTLTLKLPLSVRSHAHHAGVGKLDGVAHEVEQHLGQALLVAQADGLRGYVFAPRAARVQEPANPARPKAARPAVREATPASAEGEQGGAVGSASWSKAVAGSCPHG